METRPLNWGAIAAGWAVKTLVGGLFGGIVGGIVGASNAANMMSQMSRMPRGTPGARVDPQQLAAQMQSILSSPALLISGLIVSTLFAIIGGFVTGRMAKHSEVRHAGIMGAISFALTLLLSLPTLLSPIHIFPIWATLMPLLLVIPMAILGGLLAEKMRKPEVVAPASPGSFDPIPRI